jgi:hypothetical protein
MILNKAKNLNFEIIEDFNPLNNLILAKNKIIRNKWRK